VVARLSEQLGVRAPTRRKDEVFERTTQTIELPDYNGIARTRKVEHRLKLGTIVSDSTHHIAVGSFDGGFCQRIFLERGGLLAFGDTHISNLHSSISLSILFSVKKHANCVKYKQITSEGEGEISPFGD